MATFLKRHLDVGAMVRGASRGFSVLILGEMLLRVVGPGGEQLGLPFAMLGAAGFVLAGHRAAASTEHHLVVTAAVAAVAAFMLTMPLRVMLQDPVWAPSSAITVGFAAVVGSGAGLLVRAHRRRAECIEDVEATERNDPEPWRAVDARP